MPDFNTVATFTMLDSLKYGYLDFENLKAFLLKFKTEVLKPNVYAILRRMSIEGDGKISFREFSTGITPEMPGLSNEVNNIEFNVEEKAKLIENNKARAKNEIEKKTTHAIRDFRPIYNDHCDSPVK